MLCKIENISITIVRKDLSFIVDKMAITRRKLIISAALLLRFFSEARIYSKINIKLWNLIKTNN